MLTLPDTLTHMETSVGQVVQAFAMKIDGVWIPVVPASVAADRLCYSQMRVRDFLNEGQLIGINVHGRWWVSVRSIETFVVGTRQTIEMVS